MATYITGWGHTPFGRHPGKGLQDLIVEAGREALEHSGLDPRDIGGIWLGHFNGGMVDDAFAAAMALDIHPSLRFTPATRVENACASGSAALYAARNAVLAGEAQAALVIGAEKMTHLPGAQVTGALGRAACQAEEAGESFPAIFARFARAYFARHGDRSEALAMIAAKNHANAMHNPLAQLRKPLDVAFCNTVSEANPVVAAPLRKTDCSLVSDGAAALVLVGEDMLAAPPRAVRLRAAEQVTDWLAMSRRDLAAFEGPREAVRRALLAAGVTLDDLHLAEVHDCFTIAELMLYEAMGLAAPGEGERVLFDGTVLPAGRLPVNLSGGLKAKGHPVGATGVSMHVLVARQVVGQADAMQRPGAELGLVVNMGGSAVANYASVLEGVKVA